jgi:hypothetical protein
LDVVVVKEIQLGRSNDRRPCVVVEVRGSSRIVVVPCSSSPDLYDPARHLMFHDSHKDFAKTGFRRSSYAADGPLVEVAVSDVTKTIGRLEGDLAAQFMRWVGLAD